MMRANLTSPFKYLLTGAIASLAFAPSVWAQQADSALPTDAPPTPKPVQSGEPLEEDVNIIKSDKGTIEQYRVNGRVYMVKVIPVAGPPYYLLDTDGDGELDSQTDEMRSISVPQWVLFSW